MNEDTAVDLSYDLEGLMEKFEGLMAGFKTPLFCCRYEIPIKRIRFKLVILLRPEVW